MSSVPPPGSYPRLYAAGSNARGQLGSGHCDDQHTFSPVIFANQVKDTTHLPPSASRILNIACGSNHTLVLLDNHELWVSGDSSLGQLGPVPSTTVFRKLSFDRIDDSLLPTHVAATWNTSFVCFSDNDDNHSDVIVSFGADDFGDRGVGSSPSAEPSVVGLGQALSGNPSCIKVRELVAGQHHVLASLEVSEGEGSKSYTAVVGWGASRHGQLGESSPVPKKPVKKPLRVASQSSTKFDKPKVIAIYRDEEQPIQLAVGAQHSLILHSTHRIVPLGSSRLGQLDFGQSLPNVTKRPNTAHTIGCTWSTSFIISHPESNVGKDAQLAPWRIDSCGKSNHGQLGRPASSEASYGPLVDMPTSGSGFRQLACGSEHALVLTDRGVWGWGWNEHGNLGLGHTEDVERPREMFVMPDLKKRPGESPRSVLGVWAGCGTSWILVQENEEVPVVQLSDPEQAGAPSVPKTGS